METYSQLNSHKKIYIRPFADYISNEDKMQSFAAKSMIYMFFQLVWILNTPLIQVERGLSRIKILYQCL